MNKKFIISIVIIILIIAIFSYIFILFKSKEDVPTPKINIYSINQNLGKGAESAETQTKKVETISFFQKKEFDRTTQNKYIIEPEFFLKPEINILNNINSIIDKSFTGINYEAQKANVTEIDQKVFDILYPDYFVFGLSYTQEFFIKQKFLDENYKKIENFDTEEKIFSFVNTIIDVSEKQGWYTKKEAEKFRYGVNQTWKSLLAEEEQYWKKKIIGSDFYDKILANRRYYIHKSMSRKISIIFKTMEEIALKKAYAQTECYRGGASTPGGANIWAQCCNCGFNITENGAEYKEDCGSGGCDIDLGCLNLYAGGSKPAIWDQSTGICGVG